MNEPTPAAGPIPGPCFFCAGVRIRCRRQTSQFSGTFISLQSTRTHSSRHNPTLEITSLSLSLSLSSKPERAIAPNRPPTRWMKKLLLPSTARPTSRRRSVSGGRGRRCTRCARTGYATCMRKKELGWMGLTCDASTGLRIDRGGSQHLS